MSLTERIAARTCAVSDCKRERVPDSLFCRDHLADMWRNRLVRQGDGSYAVQRRFIPRDFTQSVA